MYKRWKKLREELNIQKEDIKVIRKRVMGETHLKQINVEDEEGNVIGKIIPNEEVKKDNRIVLVLASIFTGIVAIF
jgi:serine protease inhibitor